VSVSVAAYRKALKERTRERVSQPAANALMTLAMFARSRQRYRGPSDSPNRLDVAEEHRILFCARLVHTFQGGWARELLANLSARPRFQDLQRLRSFLRAPTPASWSIPQRV
jgi:hypothetical protein